MPFIYKGKPMYNVYYRDTNKALRCLQAEVDCHEDAIAEVTQHLAETLEEYTKPILALIKGSKAA